MSGIYNRPQVPDTKVGCAKCGYVGHLTFQCRNFLPINPSKPPIININSTNSLLSDNNNETPLQQLAREELNREKKQIQQEETETEIKSTKHEKTKHKRRRSSRTSSSSGSDKEFKKTKRKRHHKHRHRSSNSKKSEKKSKHHHHYRS